MPESPSSSSFILVEECYAAGDSRFVDLLRGFYLSGSLEKLVNRWVADPRPWAKAEMLKYVALPFDRPGHAVVVKRLFKHAEKTGDDALMGAFMVAFDCLVRRVRRTWNRWDIASRSVYQTEGLHLPKNSFPAPVRREPPARGWDIMRLGEPGKNRRLFHYRTRYYLQRRVWRYFRNLGRKDPARYLAALAAALARYQEEDFRKGENLLDSWSFMHACFAGHAALLFTSSRTKLREGRTLAELTPAPAFAGHWQTPEGSAALVRLATDAGSKPVRAWAVKLLLSAAGPLAFVDLRRLLFSPDEDVQPVALQLLERHPEAAGWTVAQWLSLCEVPGPAVLEAVTAGMQRHVRSDRLDAARCLSLALARPVPVARMGFDFLKARTLTAAETTTLLPQAAKAECAVLAPELTAWCLDRLLASGVYDRAHLSRFFDSLLEPTRGAAWEWLTRHQQSPAWEDAALWSELAETPFDDLRLRLVDTLAIRSGLPGRRADDLSPVWTAVLLGVHRGGRQKLKAVRQIAEAIRAEEARAVSLLPVLAVATRSIRGPESRAGLAAVVGLAMESPALEAAVRALLPELQLSPAA